ncbi:unnamed protein product [Microthlaspi erraticum]|uniref:RBR-type E3 ubiquitin transferase n=1 Tax=Microthlaspi erraticum TaxID=1685480 RepID=A0A6D2IIV0_9BRAS|nr:unnamed protein product [Microthlaspi erraticum]CAA7032102.1 unnamed protein product [Microthlaspi erraticum]
MSMTSLDVGIRTRSTWYPRRETKKTAKKESCVICLDDDIDPHLMFSVDKCRHRFCLNCGKRHIKAKLLDGKVPDCLQHRCKSQLRIARCVMLLTRKLRLMWEERITEDSIPLHKRLYCPNPRCSYLMSTTELLSSSESTYRRCFICGTSFCIYCKVPWHSKLSCSDYKKLHTNLQDDDAKLKSLANLKGWRQCGRCQHMVELSSGCIP